MATNVPAGVPAILATRILACVHILVGAACSLVAVPFIGIFLLNEPTGNAGYQSAGLVFVPLFLIYFAPSVVGGFALLFNARWARLMLVVQAVPYLLLVPIGTALGIATLIVLVPQFMADKNRTIKVTLPKAGQPMGPVSGVLLIMALVGSGFIIALNLLFQFLGDKTPEPLGQWFWFAVPVFPIALIVLIRSLKNSTFMPRFDELGPDFFYFRESHWAKQRRLQTEENLARIARLEKDPALRKYTTLMRDGEQWSDEAIAYDRDPMATYTCSHLQPVERAMRAAGIEIRLKGFGYVEANCCVDEQELAHKFALVAPASYYTMQGDRPYDPPWAVINCREHQISMVVVHPDSATPDTPWFPSA